MGHSNGKITAPVNTDDVSAVLGHGSHDVKTLCMYDNIKKFSRHKPVRRNSPADTDFDNDNYQNASGIYAGGTVTEYTGGPIYWGLRYPMNNSAQGILSNKLFPMCWAITKGASYHNHPNFVYEKLQTNDFGRITDFIGYSHNAKEFLVAGVSFAKETDTYAELDINLIESSNLGIGIYGAVPGDCGDDWKMNNLIPDTWAYRLIAEFYKWTDYTSATKQNAASKNPFAIYCSKGVMGGSNPVYDLGFTIPLSEIKSAYGSDFPTNGNSVSFCVCVGFNYTSVGSAPEIGSNAYKITNNMLPYQGQGFIAPWKGGTSTKSLTCVTIKTNATFIITPTQYASLLYPTYKDFPTTQTPYNEDNMRFKIVAQNIGNNPLTIISSTGYGSGHRIRVSAHGRFNTTGNGSYITDGDYTKGPTAALQLYSDAACKNTIGQITAAAGETVTFYGNATGFIPHGNVDMFLFEISDTSGTIWTINGVIECNFQVS